MDVTVIYINSGEFAVRHSHLSGLAVDADGQVSLPRGFKAGKKILAVLEDHCTVLDCEDQRHDVNWRRYPINRFGVVG